MKYLKQSIALVLLILSSTLFACNPLSEQNTSESDGEETKEQKDRQATAYFASGCFWCVEAIFESVEGVSEAVSGYAGGEKKNPSYEEVSRGSTSHAESVKVYYDPAKVDFKTLVEVFFGSHDPTTLNRQGPDRGTQYRSIAFYQTKEEKQIIEDYIQKLEEDGVYEDLIVTQVKRLKNFYKAEEYHQDYESKNPDNPYVRSVSIPRLNRFRAKYPDLLKENH